MIEAKLMQLRKEIIGDQTFKENIVCLLFYGSQNKEKGLGGAYSDFDFHLVLKNFSPDIIRRIKEHFLPFYPIDLSIHNLNQIEQCGHVSFQNGTQGQYFLYVLANARVLIGENIYTDLVKKVSDEDVKSSLLFKIREYNWRLKRYYLENTHNAHQIIKYSYRLMLDVSLFFDLESITNIHHMDNQTVKRVFLSKGRVLFPEINLDPLENLEEESRELIIDIFDRITDQVLKLFLTRDSK